MSCVSKSFCPHAAFTVDRCSRFHKGYYRFEVGCCLSCVHARLVLYMQSHSCTEDVYFPEVLRAHAKDVLQAILRQGGHPSESGPGFCAEDLDPSEPRRGLTIRVCQTLEEHGFLVKEGSVWHFTHLGLHSLQVCYKITNGQKLMR